MAASATKQQNAGCPAVVICAARVIVCHVQREW
jgi:hypothetical protein